MAQCSPHRRSFLRTSQPQYKSDETSVTNYQSVLQYARGKLDFVIGEQLYMCPSDMTLTLLSAHISGYNNEVLVATKDMAPVQNSELNAEKLPLAPTISIDRPSIVASQQGDAKQQGAMQPADVPQVASSGHEDTKTLLTVASIGAGVIYYLVAR